MGFEFVENSAAVIAKRSWKRNIKTYKSVRFSKESVITSMNAKEIKIKIDLNIDNYESTAWGCDLTEEYVVFNSAYST